MSALKRASRSFPPFFRSMLTSPLVRSPYSTEGIPLTISTLAMSSVEMERMSIPLPVVLRPVSQLLEIYCILASLLRGTPSITNEVPNEVTS